jgi:CsoR family transcriptional regulator, copper-sensing transcriptional repressor
MLESDAVPERLALLNRLQRVESRLRVVRQKVEGPTPCVEILQELAAAEAALARIGPAVFKLHVDHCLNGEHPVGHDDTASMGELVDIFDRFAH